MTTQAEELLRALVKTIEEQGAEPAAILEALAELRKYYLRIIN